MSAIKFLRNRVKMTILRLQNGDTIFEQGCDVTRDSYFEGNNHIGSNVFFGGSIGFGSYIGKDSEMLNVKIGRFTCIGERVKVIDGKHPTEKFVSLHPAFFSVSQIAHRYSFVSTQKFQEHNYIDEDGKIFVDIGNDVWIGSDVKILSGVKIGNGAVVAAGSIVKADVEPYSIVGGVPAKQLKRRFAQDEIQRLCEIRWWDWEIDTIKEKAEYFEDIEVFLNLH